MAMTKIVKSLEFDGNIGDRYFIGDQEEAFVLISETPIDVTSVVGVTGVDTVYDQSVNVGTSELTPMEIPGLSALSIYDLGIIVYSVSDHNMLGVEHAGTYVAYNQDMYVSRVYYLAEEDVTVETITYDGDPTGKEYIAEM